MDKKTKKKKCYYIVIHGIHRNPDELRPGESMVGGMGGEFPRSLAMYVDADSDEAAKEAAKTMKEDWLKRRKTQHENIVKVTKMEIYRMEKIK